MGTKENLTADISALTDIKGKPKATTKRSRSKSVGPGGLDALKEDHGNRRKVVCPPQIMRPHNVDMTVTQQSAIMPVVKSILKPTIPLSPPKPIPPHPSARKYSPTKLRSSPGKQAKSNVLIPGLEATASVTGLDRLSNPFEHSSTTPQHSERDTKVALRTEEEQQLAAKEREESERRELEKRDILERRDARRKSLGRAM